MNYKLALELKNAGFPQNHKWVTEKTTHCTKCASNKTLSNYEACRPTLLEIIEACGDKIVIHSRKSYDINEEYYRPSDVNWVVYKQGLPFDDGSGIGKTIHTESSTLEEAVARLYLALNKK